jgi:lauroyl/myristoyl acyltransferase
MFLYPPATKGIEPILKLADAGFDNETVRRIAKQYLISRKWVHYLMYAWPNWRDRMDAWVNLEGEEYLRRALEGGKGVFILTGHGLIFERFVAPVLAHKGYRLNRAHLAINANTAINRWGDESYKRWRYINYRGDYWHHARVLNEMRRALEKNEIVHVSIRGFPEGDAALEIDFYYKRFFLEPFLLRVIELLQSPVVPCLTFCDQKGKVTIRLHSPIRASIPEIMAGFGPLYGKYLREYPHYARFWSKVIAQEGGW